MSRTGILPRERLLSVGGESISEEELIAVILGTGRPGVSATRLAGELIDRCGGLAALSRASVAQVARVPGIGPARAARLVAAFHLSRRALAARAREPESLSCASDVFDLVRSRFAGLLQEVFLILALDVRNAVIAEVEIARGTLTNVEVHPREVFRPLIGAAAAAAIAVHNHPSGDPEPSPEDSALTARLRAVGDLVGIPLLDHVVIGADKFISMAERDWLFT